MSSGMVDHRTMLRTSQNPMPEGLSATEVGKEIGEHAKHTLLQGALDERVAG